jgi:hypothetical protein
MMAQQAMLQQSMAMQQVSTDISRDCPIHFSIQMMPSQMMMAAPGMGYIQMAPSQFGQIGMSHLGPVLIQPFPVQTPSRPVSTDLT